MPAAAHAARRPRLGDTSCFAIIDRLAGAEVPLPRVEPPGSRTGLDTPVRLTEAGARVLGGRADHVALSGVGRWIGGVRLRGRHVPWRWDDATETLVHMGGRG